MVSHRKLVSHQARGSLLQFDSTGFCDTNSTRFLNLYYWWPVWWVHVNTCCSRSHSLNLTIKHHAATCQQPVFTNFLLGHQKYTVTSKLPVQFKDAPSDKPDWLLMFCLGYQTFCPDLLWTSIFSCFDVTWQIYAPHYRFYTQYVTRSLLSSRYQLQHDAIHFNASKT